MTKRHLTMALGLLLAAATLPGAAQLSDHVAGCESARGAVGAVKVKPDLYMGSIDGDFDGAVTFVTLKEWVRRDGTRISLVDMTFAARTNVEDAFHILLDVVDSPRQNGYVRTASGTFQEGTGIYSRVEGKAELSGEIAELRGIFKGVLDAVICSAR